MIPPANLAYNISNGHGQLLSFFAAAVKKYFILKPYCRVNDNITGDKQVFAFSNAEM